MQNDLSWFVQKGQTQSEVDLTKLIDDQYVKYAIGQMGRYER